MKLSWLPWVLRKQVQQLNEATSTCTARVAFLEQENSKLKANNQCLSDAIDALNEINDEQVVELKQLRADNKMLRTENNDLADKYIRAKRLNEKWVETAIGRKWFENILLTKSFWGKNLEVLEGYPE